MQTNFSVIWYAGKLLCSLKVFPKSQDQRFDHENLQPICENVDLAHTAWI